MASKRTQERTATTFQDLAESQQAIVSPSLPLELILDIFDLVCSRTELLTLCRVSKACQSWINPRLYQIVILQHRKTCRLFHETVKTFSKRNTHTSFLATHTKTLVIACSVISDAQLDDILMACSNITSLSTLAFKIGDFMSRFKNIESLTHLHMHDLFSCPIPLPVNLTHLSCTVIAYDFLKSNNWRIVIGQTPNVTHLAVTFPSYFGRPIFSGEGSAMCADLLTTLALLPPTIIQIIVILRSSDDEIESPDVPLMTGRFPESPRIVLIQISHRSMSDQPGYLVSPLSVNSMLGWDYPQAPGAEDIWALGDRIARSPLSDVRSIL